ncbi:MAG: ribose-5-phosphate isomerase RpiA [Candidatus Marsarchaeota archaeon]|nr:ribose-5-phosphate isomerase RpiA [Candidatus Marsarchaeota archaeon]
MDDAKRKAAEKAVDMVEDNTVIGVGSGSTVAYFIDELARSGKKVSAVPTSMDTVIRLASRKIPITTLFHVDHLDLCFDGADQVDPSFNLIKGGGGALTMEKIVSYFSDRSVIIVDSSKMTAKLGYKCPVPLEIVPSSFPAVRRAVREKVGAIVELRSSGAKLPPTITDNGLALADAWFENGISSPAESERKLKLIPGVLENGLFCDLRDVSVIVSDGGGVEVLTKPAQERNKF